VELLKKGDPVQMTERARLVREREAHYFHDVGKKTIVRSGSLFGIVAHDQTSPDWIRIVRNGTKTPQRFRGSHWERIPPR